MGRFCYPRGYPVQHSLASCHPGEYPRAHRLHLRASHRPPQDDQTQGRHQGGHCHRAYGQVRILVLESSSPHLARPDPHPFLTFQGPVGAAGHNQRGHQDQFLEPENPYFFCPDLHLINPAQLKEILQAPSCLLPLLADHALLNNMFQLVHQILVLEATLEMLQLFPIILSFQTSTNSSSVSWPSPSGPSQLLKSLIAWDKAWGVFYMTIDTLP